MKGEEGIAKDLTRDLYLEVKRGNILNKGGKYL